MRSTVGNIVIVAERKPDAKGYSKVFYSVTHCERVLWEGHTDGCDPVPKVMAQLKERVLRQLPKVKTKAAKTIQDEVWIDDGKWYVYGVYEQHGQRLIPRYIGKGKGVRWLVSGRGKGDSQFDRWCREQTVEPVRRLLVTGLNERQALAEETRLICVIGRQCRGTGPLLNKATYEGDPFAARCVGNTTR